MAEKVNVTCLDCFFISKFTSHKHKLFAASNGFTSHKLVFIVEQTECDISHCKIFAYMLSEITSIPAFDSANSLRSTAQDEA